MFLFSHFILMNTAMLLISAVPECTLYASSHPGAHAQSQRNLSSAAHRYPGRAVNHGPSPPADNRALLDCIPVVFSGLTPHNSSRVFAWRSSFHRRSFFSFLRDIQKAQRFVCAHSISLHPPCATSLLM